MTMDDNSQSDPGLDAPPELAAAFKKLMPAAVFIPRTVDEAVLRAARERLAPATRPRPRVVPIWLRWPALVGFATTAVIAVLAIRTAHFGGQRYAREDINHDGRVDILDSFDLARRLRDGRSNGSLDQNGDGVVDQRDVQWLAARAVNLDRNPPL